MKYVYPVILEADEENPDWINVTVPDIFGGVTCGKGEEDALFMAKDLIRLMLAQAPAQCGPPTPIDKARMLFPNERIVAVEVDV